MVDMKHRGKRDFGIRAAVLAGLLLSVAGRSSSAQDTTVALTFTLPTDTAEDTQHLAASLLTLLELEVSRAGHVTVVERRQLDRVLHELALSVDQATLPVRNLRLGKLIHADLLLTMELLPHDEDAEEHHVLVRIVESLTGAIRGSVVTRLESVTVEDAAVHIARYLTVIAVRPSSAVVTVAVAPFESLGRFDRLKPLELGLRDMITSRLQRWGDLPTSSIKETQQSGNDARGAPGAPFLVLQRSNMKQLLAELDLLQSSLTDATRLPDTLPARSAAYLVRGTINEQNQNGLELIVSAEILDASSGKTVREFSFTSTPRRLPENLAVQVDLIAGYLRQANGTAAGKLPESSSETNEAELLFSHVVKDLRRYGRLTPADFSSRRFELPEAVSYRFERGGITRVDTPQHRHTLKKSIDRLESTLFIMPERADVSYALAFCYSYHLDGIMNLPRADELLRRVISSDGDGPMGVAALRLLSELCFHHNLGKCAPGNHALALSQLLFAFRSMPDKAKNANWADIPDLMRDVFPKGDVVKLAEVTEVIVEATENAPPNLQYKLAMNTIRFADAAQLATWAEGDNLTLKQVACRGLAQRTWSRRNYEESARWYLTAADALLADRTGKNSSLVDNFRILAAGALTKAGKLHEAVKLLESFRPKQDQSVNLGYWAQRIGECYEQLGKPEKALAVYVEIAGLDEGYVNNTDLVERIVRLGGVPLSNDREINVRYVKNSPGDTSNSVALTTDGHLIFSVGNFARSAAGKPGHGVFAYDPTSDSWKDLSPDGLGKVTCIDCSNGAIWVGTHENGLWCGDTSGNRWKQFTEQDGLPDMTISALAADQTGVFVGVGAGSGGLVRVHADGSIDVLEGKGAPERAPIGIAIHDESLFTSSRTVIREMNLQTGNWKPLGRAGYCRVFGTESGVWGTFNTHQLFRMDELKAALNRLHETGGKSIGRKVNDSVPSLLSLPFRNGRFDDAWYPRGEKRSSYHVRFAVEWGDEIWFGGSPVSRFQSVGLYRCNLKTGEFTAFSPHDGFRPSITCVTNDAVVRGNELYVATSAGLVAITRRGDWNEKKGD